MEALSLDIAYFIIIKARQFDAQVPPQDPDPGSNPADDAQVEALESLPENSAEEELRGAIEALSDEQVAELTALLWLGRGDYAAEQWDEAVAEAERVAGEDPAVYFLGTPLLGDHLENGLSVLGLSCKDVEADHL